MKKAQMLKFLFYSILALFLFIPTVLWASGFFKIGDKSFDSFTQLSGIISTIGDGEINSYALHLNQENLIIGFSKNASEVQSTVGNSFFPEVLNGKIERPTQCVKGKSCICLCKGDVKVEGKDIKCTGKIFCNQFDDIDFFEIRPHTDIPLVYENDAEKNWINGFFITNHKDHNIIQKIYSARSASSLRVKSPLPIYVQRYQDFVNVCYNNKDCITNEMIDRLNKEDALKEFDKFKEIYFNCKIKENSACDSFSLLLPERFFLYYEKSEPKALIGLISEKPGKLRLINTDNFDIDYLKDNIEDITVKDKDDNEMLLEGSIYKEEETKVEYSEGFLDKTATFSMKVKDKDIILNKI